MILWLIFIIYIQCSNKYIKTWNNLVLIYKKIRSNTEVLTQSLIYLSVSEFVSVTMSLSLPNIPKNMYVLCIQYVYHCL